MKGKIVGGIKAVAQMCTLLGLLSLLTAPGLGPLSADDGDPSGDSLLPTGFDGDGYADLAVGVPWEEVEGADSAGAVNVLYGSAGGLSATGNQMWHQNSTGIAGGVEQGDWFGYALAILGRVEYKVYLPLVLR